MNDPLARFRARVTAWYIGVFAAILVLFGGVLLFAASREISRELDADLRATTDEVARAVGIRERERALAPGTAVDALDEMRIPGRTLYVFDSTGAALHPTQAPAWVRAAARQALVRGSVLREQETGGDRTLRLFARRFTVGQRRYVAAASADLIEIEQRYPALLAGFGLAALAALALVWTGGAALARKSLVPVERNLEQMRRFVADAAHELRTPAAVLRSRAEVALQQRRSPEEYERALSAVVREAERLGRTLDNLLLLASADAETIPIAREPIFLDDVLLDAISAVRERATQKETHVICRTFEESPVRGDSDLIRQLFIIFLDNAVKFTPPGGRVEVSVSATARVCRVDVVDSGPGISVEALPHIFERFYRADAARSRDGGAGLGLSIAQVIAHAHGASLRVESTTKGGTTATITFPRAV